MMTIRRAHARGHANHGWLDSFHTFSFGSYQDRAHMGFRNLRVINEDRVAPGKGFGTHGHRDMEIVSYVLDGALEHRDSMGTGSVLRPGHVQRMSAGTGVTHSEFNSSHSDPLHFLQIWLIPNTVGIAPSYEEKIFTDEDKRGKLRIIAAPDGRNASVKLHTDAVIHAGLFGNGETATLALAADRSAWVHVARGALRVNGTELAAGDAMALEDEAAVHLEGQEHAEVLVFDLPGA
jgi:quercetin 2,3-dioxygenase